MQEVYWAVGIRIEICRGRQGGERDELVCHAATTKVLATPPGSSGAEMAPAEGTNWGKGVRD